MSREVSFVGAIQESPLPTTETSYPKDFALLDKQPFVPSTLGVHHTVPTLGERASFVDQAWRSLLDKSLFVNQSFGSTLLTTLSLPKGGHG